MHTRALQRSYDLARERYAELGVDAERALTALRRIPISMHCWQGDDVGGFEHGGGALGDGLAVTGNYPGKARTPAELRADFERAHSLIPGTKRINLHASYAETAGKKIDRDALGADQFATWIAWARAMGIGMDFNPTYFSHPRGRPRLHAFALRQNGASFLGRTRPALTRDRRGDRRGAR